MAAAGDAGDAAVVNMRTTIDIMSDSITALQRQIAELLEDPQQFFSRSPDASSGEKGPAARGREYSHAQLSDRMKMHEMYEVIIINTS